MTLSERGKREIYVTTVLISGHPRKLRSLPNLQSRPTTETYHRQHIHKIPCYRCARRVISRYTSKILILKGLSDR